MTTLIIKSKIWNKSNTPIINYKDKNYIKQKLSIEKTGIISRQKDKIIFKQTENLNNSNNSSENTNYMNEPRTSELISIEKRENDSNFYINCGDWPKDLLQLIDQNAVYFLYKGLTIENFLKEKQKYYVLNQGDIIKLGKIYLKILHIKLSGSNKKEDEDEKEKANKTTDKDHSDINKKLVSESDSNSDDDNNSQSNNDNEDNENKNEIDNEEIQDRKSEVIKMNYSPLNSNSNYISKKGSKKENESNLIENSENANNKKKNKNNYKNGLNRSFNGNLIDIDQNLDQIIKENINIKRSMSFTTKKNNKNALSMSLNSSYKINNLNNSKKKVKKTKSKKSKKEDKDKGNSKKKEKIKSKQIEKEIDKDTIKPQEKKEKGKICRICLSGEDNPIKNPLICPCTCKGSMKFIHYFCLKNWLNLKIESDLGYGRDMQIEQPTITYSTKDISCELCKTKLPDYIKHKGKIYNVSFYKPKYNKFIVLESIRDDNRRTKFVHIIPLNRRQIIKIGRLNNCDLSLPDLSISRVHCCMYIESGQLFLENNSKFGTKILVQNSKLTMSPQYPLCIEVQKTYLKLKIQKPFSLFSCCNIYTTSMTKMLVYQKQNERGFDLFCSMVFKEDEGEEEDDIEGEDNINNNINNNEDIKSNLNIENINNKKDKKNNKDNKSKDNQDNEMDEIDKQSTIKKENKNTIIMGNSAKEIILKRSELNDKGNNDKKDNIHKKELIDNDDENKSENIIDNNNMENKELIDDDQIDNKEIIKKKELIEDNKKYMNNSKNENLIADNDDIKKEKGESYKKGLIDDEEDNEKILKQNNKNNNYNNNKISNKNEINENIIKDRTNKDIINSEFTLNKSRTVQKNEDNKDIQYLIDSDFKLNGRRRSIPKNEGINKNTVSSEFKNFGNKIMKKRKK